MPSECITNPLQRELADSIIRLADLDEIRILLACGAKVNEPVTQGLRPLHYAVWQRNKEAAHLLIVRGSDINARDDCGYSALHLSAEHGYVDIMDLLLEHHAKVDFNDSGDEVYPRTQLCDEPLRLAIRNSHYEAARLLLESRANPNTRYFFGSELNLISPMNTQFMDLLLMYGANPNTRDRTGLTPLMKACRLPQAMEAVLLLLSYGADANAMTDERHDFRTVLHYAVLSGSHATVNLLLKQGARVNMAPAYQKPSVLDLAILKGDVALIQLLLSAGADVNASSPIIGSPLHVACSDNIRNRLPIMQLLLERGADTNQVIVSDDGTPLKPAIGEYISSNETPCPAVINLFLKYGAKVILKTQFRDPRGVLNLMANTKASTPVFINILEAAEAFDTWMIRRSQVLAPEQKEFLLCLAMQPLSLKHQARLCIRRHLGTKLPTEIARLPLPQMLRQYLLYEIS